MNHWETVFYSLFAFIIFLVTFVSASRKPYTPLKMSFALLGMSAVLWNLAALNSHLEQTSGLAEIYTGIVTCFLLSVVSLNFPFFMRTRTAALSGVSALGGAGAALIAADIWFRPHFRSEAMLDIYKAVTLMFSVYLVYYKILAVAPRLKKLFFRAMVALTVVTLAGAAFYFYPGFSYIDNLLLKIFNIYFITIASVYALTYSPAHHLPRIVSTLGKTDRLVFQSGVERSRGTEIKPELWKFYKEKGLGSYIDEFWYNIIVDEAIDNALEHGSRRKNDDITVEIYDSPRYLDFYIMDRGKGFDPEGVPSPLSEERLGKPDGRGLHIMKETFDVKWNFVGNEIRIRVRKDGENCYSPSNSQME